LVFTGCVTAYITPALLGGAKVLMLETLLYQKVNSGGDLPAASVIAVLLLVTTVALNQLLRRLSAARRTRAGLGQAVPA
jgi:putative spermidine/putrescine transport system permease protein